MEKKGMKKKKRISIGKKNEKDDLFR